MFFLGVAANLFSQKPHGADLKIDCASCHSTAGWEISADFWKNPEPPKLKNADRVGNSETPRFSHTNTDFTLKGQHTAIDCKTCHQTLVFSDASSLCNTCHTDLHQQTVGTDCTRCHSANNWLVDRITELHQENGFPLFGKHAVTDCKACHTSETALRFDRIGNECINCHLDTYMATTKPDHKAAGYSTNCVDCHDPASPDWFWTAGASNHLFFPLTKGHQIDDCTKCHIGGNFSNTPTDCFACHETAFRATTNPDHEVGNFPMDCTVCHGTDVGWSVNNYTQHDQLYFPIFSGKHNNEWNECAECHTTGGDYKAFSCVQCHEHNNSGNLANKHNDVSGYSYTSTACYSCHPKGQ